MLLSVYQKVYKLQVQYSWLCLPYFLTKQGHTYLKAIKRWFVIFLNLMLIFPLLNNSTFDLDMDAMDDVKEPVCSCKNSV